MTRPRVQTCLEQIAALVVNAAKAIPRSILAAVEIDVNNVILFESPGAPG